MNLVVLADDAFSFLLSWEFMSLVSWALVMTHHREAENTRAGYIYLIVASFGTLCLLLAFGLLGAVMTLWATFAPCFLWIFLGAPYIEALRGNKALGAALSAITAAVVGVVLNLAAWFSLHLWWRDGAVDGWALGLSAAALVAVRVPGGVAGGATPVPIPNTEVKPSWADGTALATAWESRSLPG